MDATLLPSLLGDQGHLVFRVLAAVSAGLFLVLMGRRVSLLLRAKCDPRLKGLMRRFVHLLRDGFLQRRQVNYPLAGVLHYAIFWGFMVLGWRSVSLLAAGIFSTPEFVELQGAAGTLYTSLREIFEVLVLFACIGALYRRAVLRPERYEGSRPAEAYVVLSLITILMISDMAFEGSSLLLGGTESGLFLGSLLFKGLFSELDAELIHRVRAGTYWTHMVCFFFFLNLLPVSKHFHILAALPNVFLKKRVPGELKPARWDSPRVETLDQAGAGRIQDLTWKQILDFFACTECGRCTDHCPAHAVGRDLSPKQVTMDLRNRAYGRVASKAGGGQSPQPSPLIPDSTVWACTTCGSCEAQCPVFVEHVDKIVDLRRHLVLMQSRFPEEIEPVFRNIEFFGDPWGNGPGRRAVWAEGLDIPHISPDRPMKTALWVGCAGAHDERYQQVIRALVRILRAGEVAFGILGAEERCCGDVARRTGNEYLFQHMAEHNIELLSRSGVEQIITACPHGFNTFKNEYPRFGGTFQVLHHSLVIQDLLRKGRLAVSSRIKQRVVYHDPCYLGRYNSIYNTPRDILAHVAESEPLEAHRNMAQSFCCGAGGGYMWVVESGGRVNEARAEQLTGLDADIVATACPFCHYMLTEGMDAMPSGTRTPMVRDIAELLEEAL